MKIVILFLLVVLAGCVNPNARNESIVYKNGEEIRCPRPPLDIVENLNAGGANLNLKRNEVQKIALDAKLSLEKKYEKIREIDPQLQTLETVHYRLCIEYTNGTFTKDEYNELIKSLPLYNILPKISSTEAKEKGRKIQLPIESTIAPAGTWYIEELDLSIKVNWIGGEPCLSPCDMPPPIKAGLEITTSSYQMPNYSAISGYSTAFTHKNLTYILKIEKIETRPAYIVVSVDEIKTQQISQLHLERANAKTALLIETL